MRHTLLIPDLNKVKKTGLPWKVGFQEEGEKLVRHARPPLQATEPLDSCLLKKLGFRKGDEILLLAAYYGQWAKSLSKAGCQVTYQDISREILEFAKKSLKQFGIKDFFLGNGADFPNCSYDWTFSFEPAAENRWLFMSALRSLSLNVKGIKIAIFKRSELERKIKRVRQLFNLISKLYFSPFDKKLIPVKCKRRSGEVENCKHLLFTLKATKKARQLARADIQILETLKLLGKKRIILEQLSKNLSRDKRDILLSVRRLNKLSKVVKEQVSSQFVFLQRRK